MSEDLFYAVIINTNSKYGSIIQEMLPVIDYYPTSYFDRKDDFANLNIYFDSAREAESGRDQILNAMREWTEYTDLNLTAVEVITSEIKKEDWSESWKAFFNIDKVSDRLVIKPSWKEYKAEEGEVVLEIDPGMSFGTGSHGTTKACLQFLDEISQPGQSLIDMGCGSGILSLAAAKLGLKPIHAFDYDADAVRISEENLVAAGVKIERLFQQDLTEYEAERQYDIVIANILAPVLIMNAQRILSAMKPGGKLILAGILHEQFEEIEDRFADLGLSLIERRRIDEWSSGLFSGN